ncbi:UNVERIFIED_CONTAM: hypothetical protein NCL1_35262 [Trichonephila clavipes]
MHTEFESSAKRFSSDSLKSFLSENYALHTTVPEHKTYTALSPLFLSPLASTKPSTLSSLFSHKMSRNTTPASSTRMTSSTEKSESSTGEYTLNTTFTLCNIQLTAQILKRI